MCRTLPHDVPFSDVCSHGFACCRAEGVQYERVSSLLNAISKLVGTTVLTSPQYQVSVLKIHLLSL